MAWSTRTVKIAVLNDSGAIALNTYNVLVTSAVLVVVSIFIKDDPTAWFISFCTLVLLSTTGAILTLFIPKVFEKTIYIIRI